MLSWTCYLGLVAPLGSGSEEFFIGRILSTDQLAVEYRITVKPIGAGGVLTSMGHSKFSKPINTTSLANGHELAAELVQWEGIPKYLGYEL